MPSQSRGDQSATPAARRIGFGPEGTAMAVLERLETEIEITELRTKLRNAHSALFEAREQITTLKEEVDKLCAPASTYGVYLSPNEDGTVNILSQGRKVKVNLHPSIKAETLKPGQELILNEGLNVVEAAGYEIQGEVVILKEQLDA